MIGDLEEKYPNTLSEYQNDIDSFLSELNSGKCWLDTAEQLIEDFKLDPKEANKLEKLYEESLGMVGKDETHYNLTHSEIVFFLHKFWKKVDDDIVLHNRSKPESLDYYQKELYQYFVKYKKAVITPRTKPVLPWWKREIGSWWQFILVALILKFIFTNSTNPLNSAANLISGLLIILLIVGVWRGIKAFKRFYH